jgi:hypothetical protein
MYKLRSKKKYMLCVSIAYIPCVLRRKAKKAMRWRSDTAPSMAIDAALLLSVSLREEENPSYMFIHIYSLRPKKRVTFLTFRHRV